MCSYEGFNLTAPISMESPISPYNEYPKNKYIFFKQSDPSFSKGCTILVNPRFKDNTKVFINPNFPNKGNLVPIRPPNIYVNPNIIKSVSSGSVLNSNVTVSPCVSQLSLGNSANVLTENKRKVLISTKNKLITISDSKISSSERVFENSTKTCLSDPYKKVNLIQSNEINTTNHYLKAKAIPCNEVNKFKQEKIFSTRTKIVNASIQSRKKSLPLIRRNSINTRFKYIRSSKIVKKVNRCVIKSKHKIVNNILNSNNSKICDNINHFNRTAQNTRKRYVYVNKYNSSSFLANSIILKNNKRNNFININGIVYKNFPSMLKKAHISPRQRKISLPSSFKNGKITKHPVSLKRTTPTNSLKRCQGQLLRSQIASSSKLKKSNVPCPVYKKFGKCSGQKNGTCIKIHNPDQILLCTKFLQGACIMKNCLLSHKVSAEKMPACKYFLEGLCSRDDCQYLHVKISPKADICKNFLEGFCKEGVKCDKRHQFLCPEFEKTQKCSMRRCQYPHTNSKANVRKTIKKKLNKKCMQKIGTKVDTDFTEKPEKSKVRYYKGVEKKEETEESLISKRPKLGSLPSFIPFSEEPLQKA